MSKKRILITMTYMRIGGAERSLLGLLESFDYTQYEVDLFLFSHQGEYMSMIPSEVNLLPEIKAYNALTTPLDKLKATDTKAYWKKKAAITIARMMYAAKGSKCSENGVTLWCEELLVPGLPQINDKQYDLGISFMAYHSILKKKVHCKKCVGWFHSDYRTVNPLKSLDFAQWCSLDSIVMVSDECKHAFLNIYPQLAPKTLAIENILPSHQLKMQAKQETPHSRPYILSVGRLCSAKAYRRAIDACCLLRDKGINITWYVLGDGEEAEQLSSYIKEKNLQKHFILLGATDNPYPYISKCTIFVQTSDFEGKSVAVREAQILGKPVLITNYETSLGQVENGVDGIIVEKTPEAVADGIMRILNDAVLRDRLSQNCLQRDYSNAKEIEKIYELIN